MIRLTAGEAIGGVEERTACGRMVMRCDGNCGAIIDLDLRSTLPARFAGEVSTMTTHEADADHALRQAIFACAEALSWEVQFTSDAAGDSVVKHRCRACR